MKFLRIAFSLVLCFGLTGIANAYRINVLDPYSTNQITSQPFDVGFAPCQAGQVPGSNAAAPNSFCFTGQNLTGSTITTLELIFPTSGPFASGVPTCDVVTGTSIFTSSTCHKYANETIFFFSGLDIPDHASATHVGDDSFLILIDELPPGTMDLPTASGTTPPSVVIPPGVTPEPTSLVLLSTGLLAGGFMMMKRRELKPLAAISGNQIR